MPDAQETAFDRAIRDWSEDWNTLYKEYLALGKTLNKKTDDYTILHATIDGLQQKLTRFYQDEIQTWLPAILELETSHKPQYNQLKHFFTPHALHAQRKSIRGSAQINQQVRFQDNVSVLDLEELLRDYCERFNQFANEPDLNFDLPGKAGKNSCGSYWNAKLNCWIRVSQQNENFSMHQWNAAQQAWVDIDSTKKTLALKNLCTYPDAAVCFDLAIKLNKLSQQQLFQVLMPQQIGLQYSKKEGKWRAVSDDDLFKNLLAERIQQTSPLVTITTGPLQKDKQRGMLSATRKGASKRVRKGAETVRKLVGVTSGTNAEKQSLLEGSQRKKEHEESEFTFADDSALAAETIGEVDPWERLSDDDAEDEKSPARVPYDGNNPFLAGSDYVPTEELEGAGENDADAEGRPRRSPSAPDFVTADKANEDGEETTLPRSHSDSALANPNLIVPSRESLISHFSRPIPSDGPKAKEVEFFSNETTAYMPCSAAEEYLHEEESAKRKLLAKDLCRTAVDIAIEVKEVRDNDDPLHISWNEGNTLMSKEEIKLAGKLACYIYATLLKLGVDEDEIVFCKADVPKQPNETKAKQYIDTMLAERALLIASPAAACSH